MSTIEITSSSQFRTLLSSTSVVVTDFYADWCGPCKAIAPTYESLSTKYSKPKTIAFTKVNVDNQQDVARQYGVTAMPTFMIFVNGSATETIRGADQRKLTAAIEAAVRKAGPAKPVFSDKGRTLGGEGGKGSKVVTWSFDGLFNSIVAFFGLYFMSLFALDSYAAAEKSRFNIDRQDDSKGAGGFGARTQRGAGVKAPVPVGKWGCVSDLNG